MWLSALPSRSLSHSLRCSSCDEYHRIGIGCCGLHRHPNHVDGGMSDLYKLGVGIALMILMLVGAEQYGEHRVQAQWDLEVARFAAIAKQEKEENEKTNEAIEAQHKKDIEHAKSEAGKSAITDYLRRHRMLPASPPVRNEGDCAKTEDTKVVDAPTCECGTSSSIEEFAGRCGQDALTILNFQEWVVREGLDVE